MDSTVRCSVDFVYHKLSSSYIFRKNKDLADPFLKQTSHFSEISKASQPCVYLADLEQELMKVRRKVSKFLGPKPDLETGFTHIQKGLGAFMQSLAMFTKRFLRLTPVLEVLLLRFLDHQLWSLIFGYLLKRDEFRRHISNLSLLGCFIVQIKSQLSGHPIRIRNEALATL